MAKYDNGDLATYYFVINDDGKNQMVQGWTDDKDMVKFYMDFHNCKHFKLRVLTKPFDEIAKILDENANDEIQIRNITVRHPSKRHRVKYVAVPMTKTEFTFIEEECKSLMSGMVNYSFIDSALPYLKKKYKDDLKMTLLIESIGVTIHGKRSLIIEDIQFDQMMVFILSFHDNFG